MLRTLVRFGLPGGRRVLLVYLPAKAKKTKKQIPAVQTELPDYDRIFAQAGLYSPGFASYRRPRGKRTK